MFWHSILPSQIRVQGQCKPNAESSLYAEVQPVLANSFAKISRGCTQTLDTP